MLTFALIWHDFIFHHRAFKEYLITFLFVHHLFIYGHLHLQVLDLKKGQAEAVIREIIFGRRARRSQGSLLTHFHIKLLLLIQEDIGEEYKFLPEYICFQLCFL